MENLTIENLQTFVVVLLGIASVLVALDKGFEVVQKWRGVKSKQAQADAMETRFKGIEDRLKDCEERLEKGDQMFDNVAEDSRHTLMVLNAMLMHFISGNDHEKLKSVKNELDNYLADRR